MENAILHGILPAERTGNVRVLISVEKDMLQILVEDDGVGIEAEYLERFLKGEEILSGQDGRKHIGISNVRDRICYLYGDEYGMEIKNREGGGTSVLLKLPYIKAEEEKENGKGEDD